MTELKIIQNINNLQVLSYDLMRVEINKNNFKDNRINTDSKFNNQNNHFNEREGFN